MSPRRNGDSVGDRDAERRPAVLVVEDDALLRMGISDHLRSNGYVVLEAASFDEARTLFGVGWQVDVVFSDVKLPDVRDGIELALWVGVNFPDVPVILTSAYDGATRAAALACGNVRNFLSKPYDFVRVARLLREATES